jgi:tetratricopeptide (TPR) repeat protein
MKKSLILIPVLAAIAAISACGNSGEKGRTLARINGDAFTEGDLDLRLSSPDDARREEILRDPELRRREFETFLRTRLQALAAQQSPAGKSASLKRRLGLLDERVVTQYFFETHLGINGGFTRAEIESYYNANTARFTGDSGRVLPLSQVLPRVVDSLLARGANLDSVYKATQRNYVTRPWAEVSIIRTADRKQAEAALKALKGGMKFSDAAVRFSNHPTKESQGRFGRVNPGDYQPDLAMGVLLDSLFFTEATRLQPGQHSGIIKRDDGFSILQVDTYTAERTPPLAEVRDQVTAEYIRGRKSPQSQQVIEDLKKKHGVRLISLNKPATEKDVAAYYQAHKEQYESPETFELYHVESSDEGKLTAASSQAATLEQFKSLAQRASENALTKAQQGYVGVVKRDFTLPYGIGMMPSLFPALDEIKEGRVGEVLQNPSTQKWHAFWLVRKAPPALKALDRVRALVEEDLKANSIASIGPRDSLAVIGRSGKVIREDDVLFLREEIPEQMRDRYTRENLVEYLVIWEIVTDEAHARGLDKERKLRSLRLQNGDNFWAGVYRDSVLSASWEEVPATLEKAFKANRSLFTRDSAARSWKPFARDVAAWQLLNARDFEIEYNTNPERYTRDSVLGSLEASRSAIFENLKPTAYGRLDALVLEKLKKRFKVAVEDPTLLEPSLEPVTATYKKAQDLHYERKLDQALSLYEKLRTAFPARAGLQDSVSFGVAQIYIEQERYPQAMAEYRRVSYLYPGSPNDYKAMFMVGFIQAEHLHQDSSAVRSFEGMLKKYPESDLSDDATWMIQNIRSGGALMPALEDEADEKGVSK